MDSINVTENCIEFLRNQETATVTFCQGRFVSKIKRLVLKYPNLYKITRENDDGSIVAHIPVRDIHISHQSGRELTNEEREAARERLANARKNRAEIWEDVNG